MHVFVVIVMRHPEEVSRRIADLVREEDAYQVKDDVWLVSYDGTAQGLAEKLGLRGEDTGAIGMVFPIANYSGRARTSAWEWLKGHLAREEV
jgi:hypothetical protein